MTGKKPTLKELIAATPPGAVASFRIADLTKEEFASIVTPTPYDQMKRALDSGSPRSLVMTGGSMLEAAVTDLLRAFVVEDSAAELFGAAGTGRGKVANIGLKVDLAYGMGLLCLPEKTFLHAVAEIRNAFAHQHDLHYFEHDAKVLAKVKSIQPTDPPDYSGPKTSLMFGLFVEMYAAHLQLTARAKSDDVKRRSRFIHPTHRPPAA